MNIFIIKPQMDDWGQTIGHSWGLEMFCMEPESAAGRGEHCLTEKTKIWG